MESRVQLERQDSLQERAKRRTKELIGLAARYFEVKLDVPQIRFDLRGKCAGQVRIANGETCAIRYNGQLLERYPNRFLSQTVAHEVAHVVVVGLFGPGVRPHGREWQRIMGLFGASSERCHSYKVEGLTIRRLQRFEYRCECAIHRLSSIRHNRARAGQVYVCRQCGKPLLSVA